MAELSLLIKATVVLAAALLCARVAGRARASVRALIVTAAFAVLLLLPVAGAIVPPRGVELPAAAIDLSALMVESAAVDITTTSVRPPVMSEPDADVRFRLPPVTTIVRIAWTGGAVLFAAPLLLALWRLRRLRRDALPWLAGQRLVDDVARHAGVTRTVDVFLHDALAAPMTCRLFRPAIGLPIDAPEWTAAELRHALVHEMEHVRRRDWPVQLMARIACALYWFHPLAWIALQKLCLESERACDDAVLRAAEGPAYAEQLVALARRISKRSPVPMLSMADRSDLAARITAVLDAHLPRGRSGLVAVTIVVGASVALTAAISPLQPIGLTAQTAAPDGASSVTLRIPLTMDGPGFEAASVRRNAPDDRARVADINPGTGRFHGRNQTLRWFLERAYARSLMTWLPDDQLIGGPEWIEQDRFTIEATAGRPVSVDEMQRMLRRVLAERFSVGVHVETRDRDGYRLVRARPDGTLGPELRAAEKSCDTAPSRGAANGEMNRHTLTCMTMTRLVAGLEEVVGRPIIDGTGLTGTYDGVLTYAPTPEELATIYRLPASDLPAEVLAGPSVFTALQEQLGLKLQPVRMTVEVLVIERAERPTTNDAPAAQSAAAAAPPAPQPAPPLAFDVVSIRMNTSGDQVVRGPMIQPGNRVYAQNIPVRFLITTAYSIEFNQIAGAPAWIDSDRFDIEAIAPAGASQDDIKAMLRTMLAERFRMAAHFESQERPIFTLVRARTDNTPGLRTAAAGCAPIVTPSGGSLPPPPPPPPPGRPAPPVDVPLTATAELTGCSRMFFPGFVAARQISMRDFANSLTNFARRRVVDGTGMTGRYDIDLKFAVEGLPPGAPQAPRDDNVPTLTTAIEEQLGLRLEPGRAAVQVLVVDRVEAPTAN
jgi:uncharacterized protein (TIGR03435 family)